MKKYLFCIYLSIFFTNYLFPNNNVNFLFSKHYLKDGKGITEYNVYSEISQRCNITFLVLPVEYDNGEYTSITICINNKNISENITFSASGWQQKWTSNYTIELNKGDNVISFVSHGSDIPQIKDIQIQKDTTNIVLKQRKYFSQDNNAIAFSTSTNSSNTIYKIGVEQNIPYAYTFTIPLYYTAGSNAYFYAPTAWDPKYGTYESSVDFRLYFFFENPDSFSVSNITYNKGLQWNISNLPCTGTYYIVAEALTDTISDISLYIGGIGIYKHQIISNKTFAPIEKNKLPNGTYPYNSYNLFTTKERSCNSYHQADPCLWLKAVGANQTPRIISYNNDNYLISDFNWGKSARIKTPLSDTLSYSILLTSNYPLYFEQDTCDLYYSKWNQYTSQESIPDTAYMTLFPHLRYCDAIDSDGCPENVVKYNCISWSAGIIYEHLPIGKCIFFYDSLYNNQSVTLSNGYFQRPQHFIKYTRNGATAENSVVDLWGTISENGDTIIKHASIKTPNDGIPHGYDWESKLGAYNHRAFHPRNALRGSSYGEILYHYRLADIQNTSTRCTNFYEMVANQDIIIRTYQISTEEQEVLSSLVSQIKNKIEIDLAYNLWDKKTKEMTFSDILSFKEIKEYHNLLKIITETPLGEYFIYNKFIEGDFKAILLINQIYHKNKDLLSLWDSSMREKVPENIIYNQEARVIFFIKSLLRKEYNNLKNKNILAKLSNTDDFNIIAKNQEIMISFNIEKLSSFSIYVLDLQTNQMILLTKNNNAIGEYSYKYHLPFGNYAIVYKLNGNINCKKIKIL